MCCELHCRPMEFECRRRNLKSVGASRGIPSTCEARSAQDRFILGPSLPRLGCNCTPRSSPGFPLCSPALDSLRLAHWQQPLQRWPHRARLHVSIRKHGRGLVLAVANTTRLRERCAWCHGCKAGEASWSRTTRLWRGGYTTGGGPRPQDACSTIISPYLWHLHHDGLTCGGLGILLCVGRRSGSDAASS